VLTVHVCVCVGWMKLKHVVFSLLFLILKKVGYQITITSQSPALYCCVCIRYRGKLSTEQLPSNDKGIFTKRSSYLATIGGYTYRHID
jgi:hypothetical protein